MGLITKINNVKTALQELLTLTTQVQTALNDLSAFLDAV